MADFKTHITTSTVLGFAYAGTAYAVFDVPLPTCLLSAGLASVSGMLPDIDSDSGVPLRESLAFASAVVPMMLVHRFQQFGLSHEWIVLAGAATYLAVRFGLGWLLKHFTAHRGMFHSLPAAAIFGEVAFLLASGSVELRCFKAGAVVLGYLSHLALDEIYSLRFRRGTLRVKKSLGTGMKLFGQKAWPNVITYAGLIVLTFLSVMEPGWMDKFVQYKNRLQAEGFLPAVGAPADAQAGQQALQLPSVPDVQKMLDPGAAQPGAAGTSDRTADKGSGWFQ